MLPGGIGGGRSAKPPAGLSGPIRATDAPPADVSEP